MGLVNHPDWHSASWLDVEELKKAQIIYSSCSKEYPDFKMLPLGHEIPEVYKISEKYSWLNTKEMFVVEEINPGLIGKHIVLESIISMMESLNDGDINRTKFIFWFDN